MSKLNFLQSNKPTSEAGKILAAVKATLQSNATQVEGVGRAYAREGILNPDEQQTISTGLEAITQQLQRNFELHKLPADRVTPAALAAARESLLLAKNAAAAIHAPVATEAGPGSRNFTGVIGMSDAFGRRVAAKEAYNENDNSHVVENTLTYNLLTGRQAPAAELFYPTTAVPSDNTGIAVTIRLFQVLQDKNHKLNGDIINFDRRNLIDGLIDDTILFNDGTVAVPVYRDENKDKFMAGVTPIPQVIEGVTIQTAPLAFNTPMNILGLSQTNELLQAGVMDFTDTLDSDVRLINLYLKVGDDVIRVRTDVIAGNNFIYVGQDNYRVQKMQLRTKTLFITKDSRTFGDAPLSEAALQPIAATDLSVRLSGVFTGEINIGDGNLQVESALKPKVESVMDIATKADITTSTGAAIVTAIQAGEWVGFDIESRRSNANRRERGQLVDTQYYTQQWAVPLRAPVTALRPVNSNASTDADDLEKLASTTFIRATGAAYVNVLNTIAALRQLRGLNLEPNVLPETLGVGRHLLTTMLIEETMDAAENVASLRSADLEDDISATMVNRIRDIYYRLYRDSKFQAVVESGAAGTTEQPTCIVMADPMTARYLMVKGDIRTIGPDFKMIVQTTPNKRIENKIIIAMGYPDKSGGTEINALHFGAMLWSPELALVLPISRKGQTSKELTVQPRFRHIVNVPVLGVLEVENLSKVVHARVPVDFNELP